MVPSGRAMATWLLSGSHAPVGGVGLLRSAATAPRFNTLPLLASQTKRVAGCPAAAGETVYSRRVPLGDQTRRLTAAFAPTAAPGLSTMRRQLFAAFGISQRSL